MNYDLSTLSLSELHDTLSELTAIYSKSMLNGLSEKEFSALRSQIEGIQKEIAQRKAIASNSTEARSFFPPQSTGGSS